MTSQDLLASLRTMFQKFRGTRWFRVTYLVLLGLIVAQLYLLTASPIACIAVLLMPITAFVIPYWLGDRKLKRFAANALPVFLVAILVAGAMSTQALLSQVDAIPLRSSPGFRSDPTMSLANGTVQPYRAPPSESFAFGVRLKTTVDGAPSDYSVFLNLTVLTGLASFVTAPYPMTVRPGNATENNTRNGTLYETRLNLTDSIYIYEFSVRNQASNWTHSGADFGPLTASSWTFYGFWVYATSFNMILPVTFYFLILFIWWYSMRSREMRTRMLERARGLPKDEEKTEATPSDSVGRAAKAAAFTCTNCGADVDETDTKCPKCGATFED